MKTKARPYEVADEPVRFNRREVEWLCFMRWLVHSGRFGTPPVAST